MQSTIILNCPFNDAAYLQYLSVTICAVVLLATSSCKSTNVPANTGAAATETIRILAYNIHHGEGMDEVIDLKRIASLILEYDPDIVALQEVDSVVARTNRVDQAKELGRLTNMEPVFGRFMEYQGGAYGMAMLSKWPIVESHNYRLPDGDEPRSSVTITVKSPLSGKTIRISDIHFYRTEEERLSQAIELEKHLTPFDIPTVLAGDFNSLPGSRVMTHLERNWQIVNKVGNSKTFPSDGPEREIDYFLLRPETAFEVVSHTVLSEPVASDHSPILIDLAIRF